MEKIASKRHGDILRLVREHGTMGVAELAHRLGVSLETVRRDVRPLAEDGTLLKMHGAVGLPSAMGEAPFQRRMRENAPAKRAIARAFAATIRDGDSLMFDTGTTTSFIAREMLGHQRLTVVTNSSDIARTLATANGNRVFMAGGELRSDSGAAFGAPAVEFVSRFSVMHAVISAGAIDASDGIMDFDYDEAEFARTVLSRGSRRAVVTDATKFGRRGLVTVCGFGEVETLFTIPPRHRRWRTRFPQPPSRPSSRREAAEATHHPMDGACYSGRTRNRTAVGARSEGRIGFQRGRDVALALFGGLPAEAVLLCAAPGQFVLGDRQMMVRFGMSISIRSPLRTSPIVPPCAASGDTWPIERPEFRPRTDRR